MAAGDIKVVYASPANLTLTLASLASSATAGRECTAVDNSSNLFVDAIVQVKVTLQTGTPASDKAVYVYGYGSVDGGTTYTDNATGSDAAITLTDPTNMVLLGVIKAPSAGGLAWESSPMSVAAGFGGWLPNKWGIVVRNFTNVALSATEGQHSYKYTGVYYNAA